MSLLLSGTADSKIGSSRLAMNLVPRNENMMAPMNFLKENEHRDSG